MFRTLQAATGNPSLHMREDQLRPITVRCPICSADDVVARLNLQFKPDVTLLRCRRCAAGFASRMPTNGALEDYYSTYYETPKYGDLVESHVHFSMPERLARHILRRVAVRGSARRQRLFDFGGGDGTVASLIAQQLLGNGRAEQVEITVVDYAPPRPVSDSRVSIAGVTKADSLTEGDFDFGIASASLEHVPDLRDCLLSLLNALRPGGALYVRTPYVEPVIRFGYYFGLNIDFGYPAHLYDLGEMFWHRVLSATNLTGTYRVRSGRPAIVESTLSSAPVRTVAAHMLKAPWWLIGHNYGLIGGWETVIERDYLL